VYCSISREGLGLLEKLDPLVEKATEESFRMLKPAETLGLIEILEKIRIV
jgi:hypothetical protein